MPLTMDNINLIRASNFTTTDIESLNHDSVNTTCTEETFIPDIFNEF